MTGGCERGVRAGEERAATRAPQVRAITEQARAAVEGINVGATAEQEAPTCLKGPGGVRCGLEVGEEGSASEETNWRWAVAGLGGCASGGGLRVVCPARCGFSGCDTLPH